MANSAFTMPIIVINMGGEMIYILNQRLKAQSVADNKATKVLLDVLKAMYTTAFIDVSKSISHIKLMFCMVNLK